MMGYHAWQCYECGDNGSGDMPEEHETFCLRRHSFRWRCYSCASEGQGHLPREHYFHEVERVQSSKALARKMGPEEGAY